jgi:hypothetical protein
MTEKYLLSVCFRNDKDEIFSEPFGLFNSPEDAETFADEKIYELRREFAEEFGNMEDVDEYFEFDFCIKKIKYEHI